MWYFSARTFLQIKIYDGSTREIPLPITDDGKGEKSPQLVLHVFKPGRGVWNTNQ